MFIYQLELLLATASRYKFKVPTYVQEPLLMGRKGNLQRFKQEYS